MAIHKSRAIVLKSMDFSETSYIVSLYTRDFGKIGGIAKGARRRPAKFASTFLPFSLNDVVFYERKDGGLCVVSQCDLVDNFRRLRENLTLLAYAAYFIELLDSFTQANDRNERLFDFLVDALSHLEGAQSPKLLARIVEVKMLGLSGFKPQLNVCVSCEKKPHGRAYFSAGSGGLLCPECARKDSRAELLLPGTLASLEHIQRNDVASALRLGFIDSVGRELQRILRRFLDYHLEYKLKSRIFLEKIKAA